MAKTYAYAIAGGLIATFTIAPALSLLLFPDKVEERETLVVRLLRRFYEPALEFVLANRIITFAGLALLALLAFFAVRSLGLEFLPKLEEGKSLGSGDLSAVDLSRRERHLCESDARCSCSSIRRCSRWSRSTAGRTTAPMPPAFSMPNSSYP